MSSDSTNSKWLSWFSPVSLAKTDVSTVNVASPATTLSRVCSKPLDIKSSSLKDKIGSYFGIQSSVTVKNFLPLQRLDSTGNQEQDHQPRFSYPPYKGKVIGSCLESKNCLQVCGQISEKTSVSPPSRWQYNCESVKLGGFWSTLSGPVCKAASRFASLPTNLDKTEGIVDSMSNQPKKITPLLPKASTENNKRYLQQQITSKTMVFNYCPNGISSTKCPVPDSSCSEIQIMSTECFNEVQSHNALVAKDHQSTNENSDTASDCCSVSGCSDIDSSSVYDSASDTEDTSDSDFDDYAQASCHSQPTSDTDSEDLTPWDKLTISRRPWTQKRAKKAGERHFPVKPSHEQCPEDSHTKTGEPQRNEMIPDDFTNDSVFTEVNNSCDLPFEVTVKRPVCSNSHISFILGCSNEESDSDAELSWDEQSWGNSRTSSFSEDCSRADPTFVVENPCKIWELFERFHEPLTKLVCGYDTPQKNIDTVVVKTPAIQPKMKYEKAAVQPRQPTKVRFSDQVVVHPMVAWAFAYKQSRKGKWECYARDRDRFRTRANGIRDKIGWCLSPHHRQHVWKSRYEDLYL